MSELHQKRNGRSADSDPHSGSVDRDPVEELAAEFADRLREGERVSIEEYASRHPQLATEIRELFPTIAAMEQLNTKRLLESGIPEASAPKQLGDYKIIAEIARGGMGIVYEAEQVSLGRRVAVKVLPPHALRRPRDVRRFEREAQTAANLHHSNIVPVFGVGEEDGQRYIVMQLIHGVGLDEILREIKQVVVAGRGQDETNVETSRISTAKRSAAGLLESQLKLNSTSVEINAETVERPLPVARTSSKKTTPLAVQTPIGGEYFRNVARIGLQTAEALHYAHQNNTLHRDIKPGNLLLDEDGRIWIADFGLAKALQDDDVTCSGDIVGTMAYVAPERFQGTTTKSSDIYSLGVTLHEMLTLQKAFDGEDRVAVMNQVTNERLPSPRNINKAVPRDLETIVLKAASQQPNDRYASAAQLASDLEAFLEDRPIEARRLSRVEHAVRWCRRNPSVTALCATILLLLATVFGLLAFGYRHSNRQRERAEATSKLAIDALDQIYKRFALTPYRDSFGDESDTEFDAIDAPQIPISKDVASLLENLLEFYDELATQTDDTDAVTVKSISANRRVGDINRRLGQIEDARVSYKNAIDRIGQVSSPSRDTVKMRLETAMVYNGLGLTYSHWESRDRVAAHREAVTILDDPAATDDEQFELATSLYLLHRAETWSRWIRRNGQTERDDTPKQLHLDRARQILGRLKAKGPDRAEYDLLLARCLLTERDRSEVGDSLSDNQRKAISILDDLVQRHPENPDYRFELGQVYQAIERRATRRGREPRGTEELAEAGRRLRSGLEATAELEVQHPNIPKYYLLKKELHEFLGRVLRKQEKLPEAERQYASAIQMQRLLISRDESPEKHEPWLHRLELDYGKILRDSGELDRAKDSLSTTVRQLEELVASERDRVLARSRDRNRRTLIRQTLEAAYFALASVLEKLDDTAGAHEMKSKAEELGR